MSTEHQARLDAMADAETLRLAWREAFGTAGSIFDATYAMNWPSSDGRLVKHHASISARAAFRAVPALRAETK